MTTTQATRITIPYQPHKYQKELHALADSVRFAVILCHRRFGKTYFALNWLIKAVIQATDIPGAPAKGFYCCPKQTQARKVAWEYLLFFANVLPGFKPNKQELSITFLGGKKITLAGSDTADAHRGIYLDALVLDETAQMSPRVWGEIFRPALADRKGKSLMIGTPKGRANLFYELFDQAATLEQWGRATFTVADTGGDCIDEEELEAARREMTKEEYDQEFMCSFDAAIRGAYYADEMAAIDKKGQITKVAYQPDARVYTCCDLGMRDAFGIWYFQLIGNEVHVIDYDEYGSMGLPAVIREMEKKGYLYAEHYAPHDIRVRELGTGVSREETARKLGVAYRQTPNIPIMDGIDAARILISRCWFDAEKCKHGIEALRNYRAEYDDKKRIESSTPVHDWSSHAADAFRYVAVNFGKGTQKSLPLHGRVDWSKRDSQLKNF